MSTKEKAAVQAVKENPVKPAKDGNLRQICSGQGSGGRFLNVWSN
jgi:hypothetical protein